MGLDTLSPDKIEDYLKHIQIKLIPDIQNGTLDALPPASIHQLIEKVSYELWTQSFNQDNNLYPHANAIYSLQVRPRQFQNNFFPYLVRKNFSGTTDLLEISELPLSDILRAYQLEMVLKDLHKLNPPRLQKILIFSALSNWNDRSMMLLGRIENQDSAYAQHAQIDFLKKILRGGRFNFTVPSGFFDFLDHIDLRASMNAKSLDLRIFSNFIHHGYDEAASKLMEPFNPNQRATITDFVAKQKETRTINKSPDEEMKELRTQYAKLTKLYDSLVNAKFQQAPATPTEAGKELGTRPRSRSEPCFKKL
jgi:hypothetical protein